MSERRHFKPRIIEAGSQKPRFFDTREGHMTLMGTALGITACAGAVFYATHDDGQHKNLGELSASAGPGSELKTKGIDVPRFYDGRFDEAGGFWDGVSYVQDGVGFRRAILVLEARNDPRLDEMRSLYNDLKDANGGKEYLQTGEEFAPKPGEEFWIQDPFGVDKSGIYLRSSVTSHPREIGDDTFLYNFMAVRIIGYPVAAYDVVRQKEAQFVEVEVSDDSFAIVTEIKAQEGARGYISTEWLGGKVSQGN